MDDKVQLVDYSIDDPSKEKIFCFPPGVTFRVERLSRSLESDEVTSPNLKLGMHKVSSNSLIHGTWDFIVEGSLSGLGKSWANTMEPPHCYKSSGVCGRSIFTSGG